MNAGSVITIINDQGEPIALDDPSPFLFRRIVQPDEIDGQGHVNNAIYVKWMDDAAMAHSTAVGYGVEAYHRLGTGFVVRRHEIDYLAQAHLGDRILAATWSCRMEKFTAYRKHQIVRESDGVTLVRAKTLWIYIDMKTGRPKRMPEEMIAAFVPRQDQD